VIRALEETADKSCGLVSPGVLASRLSFWLGCEHKAKGDFSGAIDHFIKAAEIILDCDITSFHLADSLAKGGQITEACALLDQPAVDPKPRDRAFASRAAQLAKRLRKRNSIGVRCPMCGARGMVMRDKTGDVAECPKCREEFVAPEDVGISN
ncbi:MAG: hypothetical protein QGD94_12640, partial [Planctomycetia bacterium]|nr:hypothetical protein [Planctomycetia bacterium]